jgi:hypothetical protein
MVVDTEAQKRGAMCPRRYVDRTCLILDLVWRNSFYFHGRKVCYTQSWPLQLKGWSLNQQFYLLRVQGK